MCSLSLTFTPVMVIPCKQALNSMEIIRTLAATSLYKEYSEEFNDLSVSEWKISILNSL